ncbi:MAG: hypothetical protein JWM91_4744 [Rhodospirillales bacterium]|nr:hypothetical protein [Rhodospirillales bacterium]
MKKLLIAACLEIFAAEGTALADSTQPASQPEAPELDRAFDRLIGAVRQSKDFITNHVFFKDPENRAAGMAFISSMVIRTLEEDVVLDADYPFFRVLDFRIREGGDNPDQRYLFAPVRGGETYRVWGRLGKQRRLDFQMYAGAPYIKGGGRVVSNLAMENIIFDKDGRFEVILSPHKRPGNWMENSSDSTKLMVRQIFSDWKNETPGEVHIDRVGYEGALKPRTSEGAMADKLDKAAADLVQTVEAWPSFVLERYVNTMPANSLTPMTDPVSTGGVQGRWMSEAHFDLKDDEALIITTWPMSGNYQGIQLTDLWFSSLEYANRQSSLTADQAYRTSDGAYHFVVSSKNPRVQNWLDTGGLRQGTILLRFDGMKEPEFPKDKQPTIQTVKFAHLRKHLPSDTPDFSLDALRNVIAERRANVQTRFGN